MRPTVLIVLVALAGVFLLLRWFTRTAPEKVARAIRWSAFGVLAGFLVFLAATGRLHWLFALGASLLPFLRRIMGLLRYIPLLRGLAGQWGAARGRGAGRRSTVRTRYLLMTLDHDSGELDGEVVDGEYRGRRLGTMELSDLLRLYGVCCETDTDSAALLENYLDRRHGPAWRQQTSSRRHSGRSAGSGDMSRAEALQILGLEEGAARQEIIDAHRRMIQRLHPDRGGSDWLAAKINKAKETLLS